MRIVMQLPLLPRAQYPRPTSAAEVVDDQIVVEADKLRPLLLNALANVCAAALSSNAVL
jgi:hypothetical protein